MDRRKTPNDIVMIDQNKNFISDCISFYLSFVIVALSQAVQNLKRMKKKISSFVIENRRFHIKNIQYNTSKSFAQLYFK